MALTPLARGRTAEVRTWTPGSVLKLFLPGIAETSVAREAANARAAHAAGAPTPAVLDTTTVEGRPGIVFARADGPTMLEALIRNPGDVPALAKRFAALHATLGACAAPLPSHRERLAARIPAAQLDASTTATALAALDALPDGDALCHGDFHPGNVLMTSDGLVVIDWQDATRGDHVADLARTSLLLRFGEPPDIPPAALPMVDALRTAFHDAWLAEARVQTPFSPERLAAWQLPVAAARLAEPMPPREREATRALVARALAEAEGPRVPSTRRV